MKPSCLCCSEQLVDNELPLWLAGTSFAGSAKSVCAQDFSQIFQWISFKSFSGFFKILQCIFSNLSKDFSQIFQFFKLVTNKSVYWSNQVKLVDLVNWSNMVHCWVNQVNVADFGWFRYFCWNGWLTFSSWKASQTVSLFVWCKYNTMKCNAVQWKCKVL